MIRNGEEVQIIDNNTKDDLTEVTLAQIIYEEQKAQTRSVPLQTLKEIFHSRTEKVLENLREGPIGRLIPSPSSKQAAESPIAAEKGEPPRVDASPKSHRLVEQARANLEEVQHRIDERVRAIVPSLTPWRELEEEVRELKARIDALERR